MDIYSALCEILCALCGLNIFYHKVHKDFSQSSQNL